jgi:hypothetical protein
MGSLVLAFAAEGNGQGEGPGLMAKAGAKELMQNGIIWISASAFSLACRIPSLPKFHHCAVPPD